MQNDKAPQIMVRLEPRPLWFLWLPAAPITLRSPHMGKCMDFQHREDKTTLLSIVLSPRITVHIAGNMELVRKRR